MPTTDSFTRCWRRPVKSLRFDIGGWPLWFAPFAFLALLVVLALLFPAPAIAQGAAIQNAKLEATEDGIQLNADIELQLAPFLQDALRKGVPLYFVADFELRRGRWYWLDQKVVETTRERRVSYAPLTEQYRVITSGISQNVASFDDVRKLLSRVRSWTVAEKGQLKPGERYEAALRFRLDTSQLPKPFQLNVLTSKEWTVNSDWHRWEYTP